ncbi:DNA polymerase IV [Motiliproteus coralliicola]|uniref:DNA polymerase IV n=1 Tax=Motiliproteus coralliicola TaxID=2283196 RepID=A0A369WPW7_9GAMM|nr:DNA polymerase IV [Motiliproteus coralliicola]RDE24120.1 DNA polymerase IV [Motiliproteus coralliicola]
MQRKIIHADCDCFFAAVEMRDDPSLRDIPFAIGGDPGRRGVISTCNYPAREFGIHSAMASGLAVKRCPQLRILPGNMDKYREASAQIDKIFRQYTDLVEPLSLDEAFLDVSHSEQCHGSATRMAEQIRRQVAQEVGITISAGVAPNKFLAKVASDWQKPDGLTVIRPEQVDDFVRQLPVKKIPGVGPVTAAKLAEKGVSRCEELQRYSLEELQEWMGRMGERLYQRCRGIDHREVQPVRERKSLSVEHTFATDLPDLDACHEPLVELFKKLQLRLARKGENKPIAGVLLKLKFDDFSSTTVETRIDSCGYDRIHLALYRPLLSQGFERGRRPVRLLGVGVRFTDDLPVAATQLALPF